VPPFYATVELTGGLVPEAAARPAIRPLDLSRESATNYTRPGNYRDPQASLLYLQNSRTDSGITYLELHYGNHPPKVVIFAMKSTSRRPNSPDVQIGESTRAHRLVVGMTQGDLARGLGVSFQQIPRYEKGVNRVGARRLPQIARICAVELSDGEASHLSDGEASH
jgi:DNA-binding XRE family transcriptional regulator